MLDCKSSGQSLTTGLGTVLVLWSAPVQTSWCPSHLSAHSMLYDCWPGKRSNVHLWISGEKKPNGLWHENAQIKHNSNGIIKMMSVALPDRKRTWQEDNTLWVLIKLSCKFTYWWIYKWQSPFTLTYFKGMKIVVNNKFNKTHTLFNFHKNVCTLIMVYIYI